MAGRFSGVMAQQVSMRVRRDDGHWGGMGRLYPFATCICRKHTITTGTCSATAHKVLCNACNSLIDLLTGLEAPEC